MKRVTYSPRKGNKYRIVVDGEEQPGPENLWTQRQVLRHGLSLIESGKTFSIGLPQRRSKPSKKSSASRHPSEYQAKQRRGR